MPITGDDFHFYLSGGGSNTSPAASLGGDRSTTEVNSSNLTHNIFDKVTGAESSAGDVEYRIIYIRQETTESITAESVGVYLSSNYDSGGGGVGGGDDDISIGIGVAKNTAAALETSEQNAPTAVTSWVQPTTADSALILGDLAPNEYRALYLRRTIDANAAAQDVASFQLTIVADTPE